MDYEIRESPLNLINRTALSAIDLANKRLQAANVTMPQAFVLLALVQNPGISQVAIGAVTGMDRSTTSDVLRRLERKGLVKRRRNRKDARSYSLTVTDDGLQGYKMALAVLKSVDGSLQGFSVARAFVFISRLKLAVNAVQSDEEIVFDAGP